MLNLTDLKRVIRDKTGITEYCPDDRQLSSFLSERMKVLGIHSTSAYIALIEGNTGPAASEMSLIYNTISNTESFFFRDHGQMELLRRRILPELMDRKSPGEPLRVLSAASSSGEELYSVAIILKELAEEGKIFRPELTGVDINSKALKKARDGIYGEWSFRAVPQRVIEKYFTLQKGSFRLSAAIKNMATFYQFNLLDSPGNFPVRPCNEIFDLIICRNVFIYFDDSSIERAVNGLVTMLKPGGFLLTGHSELANRHFPQLKISQFPESFIYSKSDGEARTAPQSREILSTTHTGTGDEPPVKFRRARKIDLGPEKPVRTEATRSRTTTGSGDQSVSQVGGEDVNEKLELAMRSVNSGDFEKARILCDQIIHAEPLNHVAYFILGQIANDQGEIEGAITLFNKVLYLNESFFPAFIELATIFHFLGDARKSGKYRANAVNELKKLDPATRVRYMNNMSAGELLGTLRPEVTSTDVLEKDDHR